MQSFLVIHSIGVRVGSCFRASSYDIDDVDVDFDVVVVVEVEVEVEWFRLRVRMWRVEELLVDRWILWRRIFAFEDKYEVDRMVGGWWRKKEREREHEEGG